MVFPAKYLRLDSDNLSFEVMLVVDDLAALGGDEGVRDALDFRAIQGDAGFLRLLCHALPKKLYQFGVVIADHDPGVAANKPFSMQNAHIYHSSPVPAGFSPSTISWSPKRMAWTISKSPVMRFSSFLLIRKPPCPKN